MKILVINSGSSSIKFQLLEMEGEIVLATGLVERIGEREGFIACTFYPDTQKEYMINNIVAIVTHKEGMKRVVEVLTDQETGVITDRAEIGVIGHRVVHGGEDFSATTMITAETITALEKTFHSHLYTIRQI